MAGWIKLERDIQNHWVFSDAEKFKAWCIMIMLVNYQDNTQVIEGELIVCKRGQSLFSIGTWVKKFGGKWTPQRVKTFFSLLEKDKMISKEGLRKTTRLTICKYEDYQSEQLGDNSEITKRQLRDNSEITTTKEGKEVKKVKKVKNNTLSTSLKSEEQEVYITKKKKKLTGKRLETFKIFWDKFNYKFSKSEAADSWLEIKTLNTALCEEIYKAAEIEAKNRPAVIEKKMTPKMAQGWISARRWEDEVVNQTTQKFNFI